MVTHRPELPNFRIHGCIGKANGGFANVYLARKESDKQAVAIRICPLDHPKISLVSLEREIAFLGVMKQANILPYSRIFVHDNLLCFVSPLMDYGSVTDVIHAKFMFGLPEGAIAVIVQDMVNAIQYLHDRDCIHRGIRASHIFLSSDGAARLGGFRHTTSILHLGKRLHRFHEFSPSLQNNLLWLAPEVLQQNLDGYGLKSDIYSLGIAVCEMANGFPPFADMEHMQMLLEKLRGTTPRLLDSGTLAPANPDDSNQVGHEQRQRKFTDQFHNFADVCLKTNPDDRPTARALALHSFFKQIKRSRQCLSELLIPLKPLILPKSEQQSGAAAARKKAVAPSPASQPDPSPAVAFEWEF